MFEKDMSLAFLLDFYGEALDAHTRDIMMAYYEDDLSLAEIAEDEKISRQGVRHIIKKGEEELFFLENALKLASHSVELKKAAELLEKVKSELSLKCKDDISDEVRLIDEAIATILSKGV